MVFRVYDENSADILIEDGFCVRSCFMLDIKIVYLWFSKLDCNTSLLELIFLGVH